MDVDGVPTQITRQGKQNRDLFKTVYQIKFIEF